MNAVRKRVSIVGITVALIMCVCASAYGQDSSYADRFIFNVSSPGYMDYITAVEGGFWTYGILPQNPSAGSALAATVINSNNEVQVFFISANQVYSSFGGNLSGWTTQCIACTAGAPGASVGGGLTAFVDQTGPVTHVFYEGTNGHVYELYCACTNASGSWHWDDPTSLAGAPVAASGSAFTSFIDNTVMHVFYFGTNANVYELYWTGGTSWHYDDPTSLAGAPAAGSVGSLTSFLDGSGLMHVFYLNSQHVHELYWIGGTTWRTDDATAEAGGPSNAVGSALTSFVNTSGKGDTGMHVMYFGTNEHVYALHSNSSPTWSYFDATAAAGGVVAVSGSHLTSFQDTNNGGVTMYFIGQNANVYQLFWPSEGSAGQTNVTLASGAAATASGSALAGVMTPN